jgi:membrane-associated protease RseP (regulator of RpoE activity)
MQKLAGFGTMLTLSACSFSSYSLNPTFFALIMNQNKLSGVLPTVIPMTVGIATIQLAHEFAHYMVSRWRNFRIGVPIPVPAAHLGTFGCITPLKSLPPNREALFDFAWCGPAVGFGLSLLATIYGAYRTTHAHPNSIAAFPVVPLVKLQSSFLVGLIFSYMTPKLCLLPLSQPVPVHPLCLVGYVGLVTSALNFLPLTCLDGGRACNMVHGTRVAALWSVTTLLFALSSSLSGGWLSLSFLLFVMFFQRHPDLPVRDDVTEVSDWRRYAWYGSLLVTALTLTPF